jgi:hypothetical protein
MTRVQKSVKAAKKSTVYMLKASSVFFYFPSGTDRHFFICGFTLQHLALSLSKDSKQTSIAVPW